MLGRSDKDALAIAAIQLRSSRLRPTRTRLKILEILHTGMLHLSAEDIYRRLVAASAPIGLSSIYRVLVELEKAGLIKRDEFDGTKAVFKINTSGERSYLVCIDCGAVEEFADDVIEQQQQQVAASRGYHLIKCKLMLYGRCGSCDRGANTPHTI